jgi:hypothetical protein
VRNHRFQNFAFKCYSAASAQASEEFSRRQEAAAAEAGRLRTEAAEATAEASRQREATAASEAAAAAAAAKVGLYKSNSVDPIA